MVKMVSEFNWFEKWIKGKPGWFDWKSLLATLEEPKKEEEFNEDIIFVINDSMMPDVMFPHRIHNYWFSCKVCHSGIFKPKKGANDFQMKDNWDGNYCGRCHGKVAYAPKGFENCIRCHSVKSQKAGSDNTQKLYATDFHGYTK